MIKTLTISCFFFPVDTKQWKVQGCTAQINRKQGDNEDVVASVLRTTTGA